jgi:hypothetical protein
MEDPKVLTQRSADIVSATRDSKPELSRNSPAPGTSEPKPATQSKALTVQPKPAPQTLEPVKARASWLSRSANSVMTVTQRAVPVIKWAAPKVAVRLIPGVSYVALAHDAKDAGRWLYQRASNFWATPKTDNQPLTYYQRQKARWTREVANREQLGQPGMRDRPDREEVDRIVNSLLKNDLAANLSKLGNSEKARAALMDARNAALEKPELVAKKDFVPESIREHYQVLVANQHQANEKAFDRLHNPQASLHQTKTIASTLYRLGYDQTDIAELLAKDGMEVQGVTSRKVINAYVKEVTGSLSNHQQERTALATWREAHGIAQGDRREPKYALYGLSKQLSSQLKSEPDRELPVSAEFLRQYGELAKVHGPRLLEPAFRDARGGQPVRSIVGKLYGAGYSKAEIVHALDTAHPSLQELAVSDRKRVAEGMWSTALRTGRPQQLRQEIDSWRHHHGVAADIRRFDRLERINAGLRLERSSQHGLGLDKLQGSAWGVEDDGYGLEAGEDWQ